VANLIEHLYLEGNLTAEQAIISALSNVEGAYGLVIVCRYEQDKIFAARKDSPLVIGVGDGENHNFGINRINLFSGTSFHNIFHIHLRQRSPAILYFQDTSQLSFRALPRNLRKAASQVHF